MSSTPESKPLDFPESGEVERLVLARRNLFAVTNRRGDVAPAGARDLGLFFLDMRHLSHYEVTIAGSSPLILSADTYEALYSQIDLTLTDLEFGGLLDDPQNFLHIRRKQLLDEELVDSIVLTNHLRRPVDLVLQVQLAADFADVFEIRGARRPRRGELVPAQVGTDRLTFGYRGLDGQLYRTVVRFLPVPCEMNERAVQCRFTLAPGESAVQEIIVTPMRGEVPLPERRHFDMRFARVRDEAHAFTSQATRFHADNRILQTTLERGLADIGALRLDVDGMPIVSAGIPWFAAPFGRDSIWTSMQMLSAVPQLAYDTLRLLAAYQADRDDPTRDAEPGKIMHELRRGEMARCGEIPHSPYYGTVDATPLFCILLGETYRWTADDTLLDQIFPAAERAVQWIEREIQAGGGLLRYQRRSPKGLENQCWKDSREGVSFPDGERAVPPIAIVEAQGYAAAAFEEMAHLHVRRGDSLRAAGLREQARALRQRIEERFWVKKTAYYALAVDGRERPVPTVTSNPAHLLWSRIVPPDRALRMAEVLLSEEMYTGWGLRTLARGTAVYNPLSYHNGTVWPHDCSIAALGLARYGLRKEPLSILTALFDSAQHFRYYRLPELFCGMSRSAGEFLVHYPVSCSPQAWASGAFFMMLEAILGLNPNAPAGRLHIDNPRLPVFMHRLDLLDLRIGRSRVSLRFVREGTRCHVDLIDIQGAPLRVQIELD